ncbi:Uncharacterised protein [Streptococcus pneumoniae]|nr:Uncharacterised protein [Streptococcus pneumoniae]
MNVKQKILGRLGLENDEELLNLLDLSNRLDKIKFFYPEFQFDSNNLIEMTLENTGYFKLIGTDNKKNSETNSFRRGWETILRSTSKSIESEDLGKLNKTPEGFPKGNVPKGSGDNWYFHRGHIFARQFHKFVLGYKILDTEHQDTQEKWSKSSIDSCDNNLFTQFSMANKAQAEVEEKVYQLLEIGESVYYEVKVVFRNSDDKYPIGTEIFYVPISSQDGFAHYFIPNFDFGFDLEKSKNDYTDFYKNGYKFRTHRKFFVDSYREENWQISENKACTVELKNGNFTIRKLSMTTTSRLIKNLKNDWKITEIKDIQDGEQLKFSGITLNHYTSRDTLVLQWKNLQMFEKVQKYILDYLSTED